MVSSTVNVFRYTALVSGVLYGIYHRRSLQKAHDHEKEQHAIHHREYLVSHAKQAWRQKQESAKGDGGECLVLAHFEDIVHVSLPPD
ncbi:ATP synthase E chain-domain-containing protein [Scleroderma yunnanense]